MAENFSQLFIEDSTNGEERDFSENVSYWDLMESLLYLSTDARPDIMLSVNFSSPLMTTPS